ncbi:TetR/AcrR family transcriptional regulator [Acetobacter okinawensis]|nr:TetR/AcrR family transcriptional regulator [Acetobacter okinawensis]
MRVTREQMQENRCRILEVASQLFREKGFESVTVAEVMKAAGLTHGGFYGHFSSKDDLIAQTMMYILQEKEDESEGSFADYLSSYLSFLHRDNPDKGCPTACLAGDIRRQSSEARTAMTAGIRSQIERIGAGFVGHTKSTRRREAIGTWSAMVGAIVLSRAVNDQALSNEIINETKNFLFNKEKNGT